MPAMPTLASNNIVDACPAYGSILPAQLLEMRPHGVCVLFSYFASAP